ncbi:MULTISPECIES: acyl carrier protein [Actinocatenispora]|jgi:acyl carrier protein|uniref:Acyl carrier protein n=2 Tax=Actinocatenispora TaxID=390988 RepID=A0A810KU09_9ACTN|nr:MULTISPECIES: acyl carrier protein [Actinocatenispora]BCJ25942.1 hypothetical protein Asera_00500 [Actinocatenispora sera]GIL29662.1 hypothetical protein NUM_49160 [Actinocatenispora comari]
MSDSEILAHLAAVIEDLGGAAAGEITREKSLRDDLDIDSLSMVEVVVSIEDKYGVELPDDAMTGLHTVGDLVDFIEHAVAPTPA